MVTLFLLTLLVAVCVWRLAPNRYILAWVGPLLGLLFLSLFGLEAQLRGTDLFLSDENFYMAEGREASLFSISDRYLWVLVNAVVLRYDWSAYGLPLKLINLSFLALLVALVWRIFDRDRLVWCIPVVMPYVAYLATFNLRDTAIVTATAGCVFLLDRPRPVQRIFFIPALAALYLLRPPLALASAAIWLVIIAAPSLGRIVRGRIPLKAMVVAGAAFLLAVFVFAEPVLGRVDRYYAWAGYVLGEGFAERALDRGLETEFVSGSWRRRIVVGAGKYMLAPIPTSLLTRIVRGGSEQWGMVDDVVRTIHQTSYYAMLAFLVIRWRYWTRAFGALSRGQVMLLAALFLYLPIYSVYHFGLGHQRIKIPFQLAVVLFAIVVHRVRKRYVRSKHSEGLEDPGSRIRRQGPEGVLVARAGGFRRAPAGAGEQ
jgi:hypothetical protein